MTIADAADLPVTVEDGRARLDAIDASIRDLVLARRELSLHVQRLRRSGGGPRIEHRRENEIINGYASALGRSGVTLGLAVLEICRGEAPSR